MLKIEVNAEDGLLVVEPLTTEHVEISLDDGDNRITITMTGDEFHSLAQSMAGLGGFLMIQRQSEARKFNSVPTDGGLQ